MTTISGSEAPVEDGRLRRGMRTREQILNAAIDLFGSRGFAATSMKDLASAAGVRAPAFYNHFSSKERILAAALVRTLLVQSLEGLASGPALLRLEAALRGAFPELATDGA